MPPRISLQQIMLRTLIAALLVSALVGMWVFIFGNFGQTEIKILLTTLSIAYFSVTTLACAAAQQLGRSRLVWLPGLVASAAGFVVVMLCIWPEWINDASVSKTMVILIIFAFSFAQACLLSMPRLSAGVRWVFFSALAAIFALAAVVSTMIVFEIDDQWLFRLAGVLGILDGCATLAIPILYKLGNKAPPIETPAEPSQPSLEIKLACPRCGQEGQYPIGAITCPQCGLGLRVEIVDDPGFPKGGPTGPPQYRLRTLLVIFLVASVFLGWMGTRLQYLRRQEAIVRRLQEVGVRVTYRHGSVYTLQHTAACRGRLAADDLAGISQLSELEEFYLQDGQITDEHLRHLVGMNHLRVLYVPQSRITDVGLEYIASLKGLQRLGLAGTQVTDAGLARLVLLQGLVRLELENTQISDRAVCYLQQMPSLRSIALTGSQVSEAGVGQIRRTLPNATVQP